MGARLFDVNESEIIYGDFNVDLYTLFLSPL